MARGPGMTDGDCFGSVLLHDELWRSLASLNGQSVPWVHGCGLENGHHGDHGAPVDQVEGEPQQWIRWANAGPARLERVEPSSPGRHTRPLESPTDASPQPVENSRADRSGETVLPGPGSQSEALWAIAAALERLADVVATLASENRGPRS